MRRDGRAEAARSDRHWRAHARHVAMNAPLKTFEQNPRQQGSISRRQNPKSMRADVMADKWNVGVEGRNRRESEDQRQEEDWEARRSQFQAHS